MKLKNLLLWLVTLISAGNAANAQVPLVGSTVTASQSVQGPIGQFGTVVAGANGLGGTAWTPGSFTYGTWLAFNNAGGSNGESDTINYHPGLTGGFSWWITTTSALGTPVMTLSPSGLLSVASLSTSGNIASTGATSANAGLNAFGSQLFVNGSGAYTNGGSYLAFNAASSGETDFVTQNGGSFQSFAWYFPNTGGTLGTAVMTLAHTGVLSVPGGFAGNLTGNVSGNASTSSSTSGNAATASALDHTPATCANYLDMKGILASGAPDCFGQRYALTTSVNSTSNTAYSTASTSVPLFFNGAAYTAPDANYAASCTLVNPFGVPSIMGISKSTTAITVTIVNGGTSGAEVASGGSEIDCTIAGS